MPWVYLDDHFDEHPKFLDAFELDAQAPLLFIAGLAYCRRADTRGHIADTKVKGLLGYRPRALRALLAVELWHKVGPGSGVAVHDFEEWNLAAQNRSASARNAARVRWTRERKEPDANA